MCLLSRQNGSFIFPFIKIEALRSESINNKKNWLKLLPSNIPVIKNSNVSIGLHRHYHYFCNK